MKILVTTSTLKQDVNDSSPEFINNLIEGMSKLNDNNEFIYLYPYKGRDPVKEKYNNISYKTYRYWFSKAGHNILDLGIYQSIKSKKLNYLKVISLIICQFFSTLYHVVKLKPDYIYAHWIFPQAFISGIVSKITKTNLVFTSHGSDITLLRKFGYLGKFILHFTISTAKKITVVSEKNLQKINEFYDISNHKEKFKVIPMGIDNLFFKNPTNKSFNSSESKNFLFYGRLTNYKGLDLLINAFEELVKIYPNVSLKIIGYGDMKNELINLINLKNLSKNIKIDQFKNKIDIIKEIENSDLIIVPSIETKYEFEAGPLTIVEAMARKRLCLISDSVGFISYFDSASCLVFQSGNLKSLYDELINFFNISDENYLDMTISAFEIIKEFKFENISNYHSKFLLK